MCDLEALEAIAAFGLATHHVKDLIHQLCTLSIMTLGPVVTSTRLTKDKVIGSEKLAERTSADSIHGTRFEIDEDCTGDIFVVRRLAKGELIFMSRTDPPYYLIKVDVHALQLKVGCSVVPNMVKGVQKSRRLLDLLTGQRHRVHARQILSACGSSTSVRILIISRRRTRG